MTATRFAIVDEDDNLLAIRPSWFEAADQQTYLQRVWRMALFIRPC